MLVLRYSLTNSFLLCFIAALVLGTWPIWAVLGLAILTGGGIDEAIGDDHSQLNDASRFCFDANLYATLPLLMTMTYLLLALIAWGPGLHIDVLSRSATPREPLALVGAVLGTGYFYALAGVTVAHELTHRLGNPVALLWAHCRLRSRSIPHSRAIICRDIIETSAPTATLRPPAAVSMSLHSSCAR